MKHKHLFKALKKWNLATRAEMVTERMEVTAMQTKQTVWIDTQHSPVIELRGPDFKIKIEGLGPKSAGAMARLAINACEYTIIHGNPVSELIHARPGKKARVTAAVIMPKKSPPRDYPVRLDGERYLDDLRRAIIQAGTR